MIRGTLTIVGVGLLAAGEVIPPEYPYASLAGSAGAVGVLAWVAWSQLAELRELRKERQETMAKLVEQQTNTAKDLYDRQHADSAMIASCLRDMTAHCAANQTKGEGIKG